MFKYISIDNAYKHGSMRKVLWIASVNGKICRVGLKHLNINDGLYPGLWADFGMFIFDSDQ